MFATLASWAKTYHFASTKIDPSAMGDVDVSKDKNGNAVVTLRVEHLAKPTMLTPPSTMYVVWFQQHGSNPENQGILKVGDDLRGQLRTTKSRCARPQVVVEFALCLTTAVTPATIPQGE
jgi:hypothetical protein